VGRVQPEFRRAIVRQLDLQTGISGCRIAAFRFFPVEPDLNWAGGSNFWDAATTKESVSDWLAARSCGPFWTASICKSAICTWARIGLGLPGGKTQGLTPGYFGLGVALRSFFLKPGRTCAAGKPVDPAATKPAWFACRAGAARELVARLPPPNSTVSTQRPWQTRTAWRRPGFFETHASLRQRQGAWPRIAEV
jgi:hypothetical protein